MASKPRKRGGKNNNNNWKKDAAKNNFQDAAFARKDDKFRMGNADKVAVFNSKGGNSASWYIPNSQLAKDVASIPFGTAAGLPLQYWTMDPTGQANDFNNSTNMSAILVFDLLHTMGHAKINTDPLNYAANQLFVAIQAANSRAPMNESPDLAIGTHCIAEVYSFYMFCVRAYGIMQNYDILDRNTPFRLMEAMRFDYMDLHSNLANFRTFINQMALKLATLYLPVGIDYVERRMFLYRDIYRDSNSRKAQYYLYNPIGFYKFVEGDPAKPVSYAELITLSTYTNSEGLLTLDGLIQIADDLLTPLLGSQDIMNMAANYMKAFGESNIYTVNPISESFKVVPVYNAEVLSQMENAYICPTPSIQFDYNCTITQDPNINHQSLLTKYQFTGKQIMPETSLGWKQRDWFDPIFSKIYNPFTFHPSYVPLNMHMDSVSPEAVLVATRLSDVPKLVNLDITQKTFELETQQTELCVSAHVYGAANGGDTTSRLFCTQMLLGQRTFISNIAGAGNWARLQSDCGALVAQFDWHPRYNYVDFVLTSASASATQSIESWWESPWQVDFDNFTTLPLTLLHQMNDVAAYGLFMPRNLPGVIGKATTK